MSEADHTKAGSWKKRESFGSAMVQIIIVGLILFGAAFLVYQRGSTKKAVGEKMREARAAAIRGNPADLKKGLAIAEEALELNSNAADPLAFQAMIYGEQWLTHLDASAEAKARAALEKAQKAEAKSEDRYATEALIMLAGGKAKESEAFIEDLRKRGASSARLYYAQAAAQKAQGNLALARPGFTTAMDKSWKDPFYAAAWGESLLDEGVTGAAVDAFNKAMGANPDYFRGRLGIALARVIKEDKIGEAENIVKDVLARNDELSDGLRARAKAVSAGILAYQEKADEAIATADEALAINPNEAWALFFKASAQAQKKDAAAAKTFADTVAKKSSAPVLYFTGASRLMKAGDVDAALMLLDTYEAKFKDVRNVTADGKEEAWLARDDKYWLARGDVLREAKKLDDAMAAYDKAIAAKNINQAKALYAKGALFLEKKEYDKAAELLVDITPQDGTGRIPEAYMALGEVLFAKKEWGPGCQNYAYGLTVLKMQQAPREKLNTILTDVETKLKAAGQKPIAKLWMEEAKPLIQ